MDLSIKGLVRGIVPGLFPEASESRVLLNPRGELLIQNALGLENVRLGECFVGLAATATVALDDAVPTTVAAATLWNGNAAGGKVLVVTRVGGICGTSAGAATTAHLLVEPSILPVATVPTTDDSGVFRSKLITSKTYGGGAKISKTVTVTDNGWVPAGDNSSQKINDVITGTVGATIGGKLDVPYIIPPGYYLACATVAVNATMAFKMYYEFYEVQLPCNL